MKMIGHQYVGTHLALAPLREIAEVMEKAQVIISRLILYAVASADPASTI